ncbi:MAG: FhaA domain-containing protein, partial [Limnochordia bacterium]
MRILDRIESLLENVIEGKNRKGHPQIQPVQIGKKLAKTMEANRRVSIAKTYVPNIYVIRLHPS